jgi:hypothetical protein
MTIANKAAGSPANHGTATAVHVLLCDGPLVPPIGRLDDALERKRLAVWHNDARNDLIATIATAVVEGGQKA